MKNKIIEILNNYLLSTRSHRDLAVPNKHEKFMEDIADEILTLEFYPKDFVEKLLKEFGASDPIEYWYEHYKNGDL